MSRGALARVALALLLLRPALSRAQAASPDAPDAPDAPVPTALAWTLPGRDPCLTADTFREAVRQALGREPFAPGGATDTLRVSELSRDASAVRIRIELRRGEQELGVREVDVALDDCGHTRETVAVVSAMLLDVPREPPPPVPPAPPPPAPPPAPRAAPRARTAVIVEASALFTAGTGYLPRHSLGGRAEVTARIGKIPLLRITASGSRGATVETTGGSVSFHGAEFTAGVAPFSFPLGSRVSAFVFGAAALTGVIGSASGFEVSRTQVRWVPAVAAGAALRVHPLGNAFLLTLEAQGFVPLARPRFTVLDSLEPAAELELHRVSAAGFDVGAGAGFTFH